MKGKLINFHKKLKNQKRNLKTTLLKIKESDKDQEKRSIFDFWVISKFNNHFKPEKLRIVNYFACVFLMQNYLKHWITI